MTDDPDVVSKTSLPDLLLNKAASSIMQEINDHARRGTVAEEQKAAGELAAEYLDLLDLLIARGTPSSLSRKALDQALRIAVKLPHPSVAERLLEVCSALRYSPSPGPWGTLYEAALESPCNKQMLALLHKYRIG